jgi:putative peptidoglycan lipid II flippase
VGLFSGLVNLFLALFLIGKYGTLGIVFAFSFSSILNMLFLLLLLRKRVGSLDEGKIIRGTWKIIFATLVMAIFMQTTKYLISYIVNMETFLGVFFQMLVAFAFGLGAFFIVGKLIKIKEIDYFLNGFKNKIFLKPKNIYDASRDEVGGIK